MAKGPYEENGRRYVIVEPWATSGDCLYAFAEKWLGDGKLYTTLASINGIKDADCIHTGDKIYLDPASTTSSSSSNKIYNLKLGILNTTDDTLLATWDWDKDEDTDSYKFIWSYETSDGIELNGSSASNDVDEDYPSISQQSTYEIPTGAKIIHFRVKPISKTYKKEGDDEEKKYFDDPGWTVAKYNNSISLESPSSAPSVKIENKTLTASLDNLDISGADSIVFEVTKDNSSKYIVESDPITIDTGSASWSYGVDLGHTYKVRCKAYNTRDKSESFWTSYSSDESTIPEAPVFESVNPTSETSIYLKWTAPNTAESYEIEYATEEQEKFDATTDTTTVTVERTYRELTGLESGLKYFFRVRAINSAGESEWSPVVGPIVIGEPPAAPTTWSSTTTAIVGETVILYWVHNSIDGSSQTYAQLSLSIDGADPAFKVIKNSTSDDEKDKTSMYVIDTSIFPEGTQITWQVRTMGVCASEPDGVDDPWGEWSISRRIDVYAQPSLDIYIFDSNETAVGGTNGTQLTSFPFYIQAIPSKSNTQAPTGYHVSIVSNQVYETVDAIGNSRYVNVGESMYAKYFDTFTDLMVEFTPGNIDLSNGIEYTVECTVSMNSGLTAVESKTFTVSWTEMSYEPGAEVNVNSENMTATIRPYCVDLYCKWYKVERLDGSYVVTDENLGYVYGGRFTGSTTDTGEKVFCATSGDGELIYFTKINESIPITDVYFSVYRREYDGKFTEIATRIDGAINTAVIDPHPALDFARYRIVATTKSTGTVGYCDLVSVKVGCTAIVLQWDEAWTNYEVYEDVTPVQPPWSGSLLKLPYNVDINEDTAPSVTFAEYIGRDHPVSYYGTQLGETATWSTAVPKTDKETIYALRRLAKWLGDVYVREPSGSGYWANVGVAFTQTHTDPVVPVTLTIRRVEGGM